MTRLSWLRFLLWWAGMSGQMCCLCPVWSADAGPLMTALAPSTHLALSSIIPARLKVLSYASILDKTNLERFKIEARAAASLDHPNVVHGHSVGSQMNQLRTKVDSLPEILRPHFHSLLDQKEQECLQLQETTEHTCDLADDRSLAATHAIFSLEVAWRELQQK